MLDERTAHEQALRGAEDDETQALLRELLTRAEAIETALGRRAPGASAASAPFGCTRTRKSL